MTAEAEMAAGWGANGVWWKLNNGGQQPTRKKEIEGFWANGERRMPDLNGASYQRWVPKGEALQWPRASDASDESFGREEMLPF